MNNLPEHPTNMSALTALMDTYPPEKLEALSPEEHAAVIADMETAAYADMDRRAQAGELAVLASDMHLAA